MSRRLRSLALIACAAVCGSLAAAEVRASIERVERRVGPAVPVVVAREDIEAGTALQADSAPLAIREVPGDFVPPDSLPSIEDAVGAVTAREVPAGSYLTAAHLEAVAPGPSQATPGERVVEVPIVGAGPLRAAGPGTRVDVLITSEGRDGGVGDTRLALESVELVELSREGRGNEGPGLVPAHGHASLLVTGRQALMLTAAANFAREIRLLQRPPGDGRRLGALSSRELWR